MLVTLRRTAIMWPMLLLPMASAALTTTGGSALAGKTVLGLRTVAEPRVVHSLRIPGQLWGWQVEIVVGRGGVVVVSSERWDWPDDYGLGAVPQVRHPWWTGWLAMAGWILSAFGIVAIGFGLVAWLVPTG